MYLEHFGMNEMPFSLSPNTTFYCNLPGHQEAFNVLVFALKSGESLVTLIGEVGTGKTLLCRKLMNQLEHECLVAYIPAPDLPPSGLRMAVAREIGLDLADGTNDHIVIEKITERLVQLRAEGKNTVLLIDEAQAMPDESLEALRLLTNIETESAKLLQIVLFAQPELEQRLNTHKFRQLKQRVTFSHNLKLIDRTELEAYLSHRLMTAGHGNAYLLFNKKACDLLYHYSAGTPRLINVLCHKAMLVAFGKGEKSIDDRSMSEAIKDTVQTHSLMSRVMDQYFSKESLMGLLVGVGVLFIAILYVALKK